jgi:hypothetical protein
MTQVVVNTIQNTARSTRRWMIFAFIAGMVFTAALAQTLAAANTDVPGIQSEPAFSGDHDSLAPAPMPDDNYISERNLYGLVYAFPSREAMLFV